MLLEPQALLSGVKNGNRLMFTLCYDRYHRGIYLFVLKYVRCEALAEDIVQEVFFRLWCNRRGLREEGTFLTAIGAGRTGKQAVCIWKSSVQQGD